MASDAPDELFDVRNALYIGAFQTCITEAQKVKASSAEVNEEKELLSFRAMVALGKYSFVKNEITSSSSSELQAVRRLAIYLSSPSEHESIMKEVKKQQDDGISLNNPVVALVCGTIFAHEQNYNDALRCFKTTETLETLAAAVQVYLKMDRVDVAKKELKRMQELDDDSSLTQLALAWVNLATGGEQLQQAYYIFHELAEKFGTTPLLLNGQAAAHMLQGRLDEAEATLQAALEKNSNDPDTLLNLYVLAQHHGKAPETVQRYLAQLKDAAPDHPFVRHLRAKEAEFDSLSARFATSA